jgi:hypothetical protein
LEIYKKRRKILKNWKAKNEKVQFLVKWK